MKADALDGSVVNVGALFSPNSNADLTALECELVREDALTLDIEGVGKYTLMWTPSGTMDIAHGYTFEEGVLGDIHEPEGLALALGFCLSEGVIANLEDLKSVSVCPENPAVVRIRLRHPEKVRVQRRNVVINSSCGICGPREIMQDNVLGLAPVANSLSLDRGRCSPLMAQMREQQGVFQRTGGSHAAALFDGSGKIIAVAEDLGRHNALDKAIGLALVKYGSVAGCGALLSSRLSLEMVVKAVRTRLEMLLAVSAPTSLAVEVARHFGVTLCGFVRDSRATIYTHPQRMKH